jgi:hypothetical protein
MRIWLTLCRRKQRGSAWIAPPYIPVLKERGFTAEEDNTISIRLGVAHSLTRYMIVALLLMASAASAQNGQPRRDPGCARDVARHCRSKMNDGDQVILACLKEHRAALSKTCAKVLTDNGQ